MSRFRGLWVLLITSAFAAGACGSEKITQPSDTPPPTDTPPDNTPASISASAGGGETVRTGADVAVPPAVVVRNTSSATLSGISVTFAVQSGGGSVTGGTATTDANGVARVGSWALGPGAGQNTLVATVQDAPSLSVTFTAVARLPYWTFMVYLAADNNLALAGVRDIDEMEAAGVDPEVQVVVQAEFSPDYLALDGGCLDSSCINRPNFNTFRYFIDGQGQDVFGPNGPAMDIGNRDMTDPAQLNEFILWVKDNYPAERYALVLWNHGGGYLGLLEDATSAGSTLMPIGGLPAALGGVGAIDVLDFDMCNMAGYETLVMVNGLAEYAVFSEEQVPGEGNPYREIIDGIQASPTVDNRLVAQVFVDEFHTSYQNHRASTTKSAYEMAGFSEFESALNTLAQTLRTNLADLSSVLGDAAARSQKYQIPELTDLANFLDSLGAQISDATLLSQMDAVKNLVTGSFRVGNRVRNGTNAGFGGESDVSRSTGLNIVMPSGIDPDQLADAGPRSFTAYEALYSGKPWTLFLADWLALQSLLAHTDQGNARFEAYLVWDPAAVMQQADVDLWILEPSGILYIPWLGSVTPNGTLTNDSYLDNTFFEGYLTNRFVLNGTYTFYANLWADPNDFRPQYDLAFRFDQVSNFGFLFDPNLPQLSLQTSWLNDSDPTFQEADAFVYTDLQPVATVTYSGSPSATFSAVGPGTGPAFAAAPDVGTLPRPTAAQLAAVRRAVVERRPPVRSVALPRAPSFLGALPSWRNR